jgi:hypothetical protein
MIVAKLGLMGDTLWIVALPSCQSHWPFRISCLEFSPWCWSRSGCSQDGVWFFSAQLLLNTLNTTGMTYAMQCMSFSNASHLILPASSVDCQSQAIRSCDVALSVVIANTGPTATLTLSSIPFTCMADVAQICSPLLYCPQSAYQIGQVLPINCIEHEMYFLQCLIFLHIVYNNWHCCQFVHWCPHVQLETNDFSWSDLLHIYMCHLSVIPPADGATGAGGWRHQLSLECII